MPSLEALTREELRFLSADAECAAVLFRPAAEPPYPCVVLGHGFGAVKEGGPARVAERYAEAGYAGLAFDYRHFGESGGEPRQLLDVGRQLDDWRAAFDFACRLEGIDPDRVALWGSSFAGGHVIEIAAGDDRVAAAISQVPFVDGIATLREAGIANSLRLTYAALRDLAGALTGARFPIPLVGPPGTLAAMNTPDSEPGYSAIYDEGFEWRNQFLPGSVVMAMPLYRPARSAPDVACPLLVQVATEDAVTPPAPAIEAAAAAPRGELVTYAGLGHFDVYRGEPCERAVSDQLDFLDRHLG